MSTPATERKALAETLSLSEREASWMTLDTLRAQARTVIPTCKHPRCERAALPQWTTCAKHKSAGRTTKVR